MSTNGLIFVSSLRQLEHARRSRASQLGGVKYVCLSPAVEYTAGRLGLPAVSAEDGWDPADLARRDPDRWRQCEEFARFLDAEMDRTFEGVCSRGEFSALFYLLELKLLFDSAERMVTAASSVISRFRPPSVVCLIEPAVEGSFGVPYQTGDLVRRVLESLQLSAGFDLLVQELPPPLRRSVSPPFGLGRMLRGGLNRIRRSIGRIGPDLLFPPNRNLPTVGIGRSNTLAQLPDLVWCWRKAGGPVANLGPFLRRVMTMDKAMDESAMDKRRLKGVWHELCQKSAFRAWFDRGDGVNLFHVMEPWLECFFCEGFPWRITTSQVIERELCERRVSVFLTPSMGTPGVSEALLACRRLGIRACSVQHGGMGFYTNPLVKYGDHWGTDYALTYGPGSVECFKQEFSDRHGTRLAEPVAIGNPILQRLYRKFRGKDARERGEKKRVLYIPTHLVPDFYYHGLVSYPPLWYSRLQRRIARVAKDFPDVKFHIKPYPVEPLENPLAAFIRDEGITNATFLPAFIDMAEFLEKSDLLLIDYPSTSLLKMLCTRKPMIVYFHPTYLRFSPKALELLERRAHVCRTEDELEMALRRWFAQPAWPEITDPDDGFLFAFGIGGKDADAREELKRFIPSIASRNTR